MAKKEKELENLTLEETFAQLEEVIRTMEKNEVTLEESFKLYHQGMDMLKSCNDKIDKIEKKMLVLDNEGEAYEFES